MPDEGAAVLPELDVDDVDEFVGLVLELPLPVDPAVDDPDGLLVGLATADEDPPVWVEPEPDEPEPDEPEPDEPDDPLGPEGVDPEGPWLPELFSKPVAVPGPVVDPPFAPAVAGAAGPCLVAPPGVVAPAVGETPEAYGASP